MGKVIRLYGFPSPMKFGILEYGNKDSNLEYFMFFNYLPIYRYIISKGQIAQNCPLPLLNIKIILSIINTKLFYCEFFRLCCIFLHNYSIYTIQFGSIPKSCPYSFWRGNFEQNHPQLLAVESQKLLSGHLSETKYSESFN